MFQSQSKRNKNSKKSQKNSRKKITPKTKTPDSNLRVAKNHSKQKIKNLKQDLKMAEIFDENLKISMEDFKNMEFDLQNRGSMSIFSTQLHFIQICYRIKNA